MLVSISCSCQIIVYVFLTDDKRKILNNERAFIAARCYCYKACTEFTSETRQRFPDRIGLDRCRFGMDATSVPCLSTADPSNMAESNTLPANLTRLHNAYLFVTV